MQWSSFIPGNLPVSRSLLGGYTELTLHGNSAKHGCLLQRVFQCFYSVGISQATATPTCVYIKVGVLFLGVEMLNNIMVCFTID